MHHGDAAMVDRGGETSDVGHHAPADTDDHIRPGQTPPGEGAAEPLDGPEILCLLPLLEGEHLLVDAGVDGPGDGPLGEDGCPAGAGGQDLRQAVAGAGADEHRVGAPRGPDGDLLHRRARPVAVRMRSAMASGVSSSTSTVTSASWA